MYQKQIYFFVTLPAAALILVFLMLVVAPGRGAGWMVDDGLFLANAWNFIHGFGLDGMLPQQPVYLVNALFMHFGLNEILHQRYAYYLLWIMGAWVFFSSLDYRQFSSLRIIAVIASLCIGFSSVLVGGVFFPFGAGCYFYSNRSQGFNRVLLISASGFLFAVAAFMHIGFAIGISIIVIFIYWLDSPIRKSIFLPVFIASTVFFWVLYLNELGIERFFSEPAGHKANPIHLVGNGLRIIWFFLLPVLAFYLLAIFFKGKGLKQYKYSQYTLSLLVTVIYCLKFFGAQLVSIFPGFFVTLFSGRYSEVDLTKAHSLVVDAPGSIYYILIFIVCRWFSESGCWQLWSAFRHPFNALETLKNFLNEDLRRKYFFIAIVGLCLLPAGYAGGSASSIAIVLSASSGPVLGITFLIWQFVEKEKTGKIFYFLLCSWCSIFIVFAARMNLPTFESIIFRPNLVTLGDSPLRGIKETVQYRDAVLKLRHAYVANACEKKRLILLDYVPIIHLLLQHEVPNHYGVVRPGVYFPEKKIMQELDSQFGWCVLDVTTDETRVMMRGGDIRDGVRARVIEEGRVAIALPSPSNDIKAMTLYIK
jgi:hypothetical protein